MEKKVALVTGSGRRLGRQIAIALAEAGFDIVVNYNQSKDEAKKTLRKVEEFGREAIAIKADITNSGQVRKMVEKAIEKFGQIDVLVNNAAIFPKPVKFWEITDELWDRVIDTNLKGQFLCSREVVKYMLERKKGKIINIASLGGLQVWTEHIAYNVAKAGLIMLTKAMAKALAPYITVNAIAPGTIIIPGEETGEIKHISERKIPLKRYGKPSDITDVVVFLATKGDYITGQVIAVDGGRSIL
jgi:3-oxoacyl-[acyl-carrier protein] reductase